MGDGSTDNSGSICDSYALLDKRIQVIHQKNKGVYAARQLALELSTGDFIIHCDSDDWMDSTMIEEMIQVAYKESADIIWTDFYMGSNKGT